MEVLGGLFPSEKISKSLLVSSNRFYHFVSQSVEEIVGIPSSEIDDKAKTGDMVSFLSTFKESMGDLRNLTAVQIREMIFETVNSIPKGFITSSERQDTITSIENEMSLPSKTLDALLYFDIDSEKILVKREGVEPAKLIRYFNFDTIETILCFSLNLQIKIKKMPGYIAKNLIYVSKKNYVFTDITLEEGGYKITIESPLELFSDKGGWGRNISNVATYILRSVLREKIAFHLTAHVEPRNRVAVFILQSNDLPLLPSFRKDDDEEEYRPEIDSKIENQFQKTWRNFQGWKAVAEPDALIIGKKMYVPDFLLERGKKRVYLEIVGFYTMKYIEKKKRQMQELEKLKVPIIYLIDESLKNHFIALSEIKKIYYTKINVPSSDIVKVLEAHYSDFEERFPVFLSEMEEICKEINDTRDLMETPAIQIKIKAYSSEETNKIIERPEVKKLLKLYSINFLKSYGLIGKDTIDKVANYLSEIKSISLSSLKTQFPNYKEALISISQHLGYKVKWKSIEEIEIVSPKS